MVRVTVGTAVCDLSFLIASVGVTGHLAADKFSHDLLLKFEIRFYQTLFTVDMMLPLVAPVFYGRLNRHHGSIAEGTNSPAENIAANVFNFLNITRLSATAFDAVDDPLQPPGTLAL